MEPATGTVSGGAATGAPTCSVLSAAASCPEPLQQHWVSFQERASRAVWEAGAILDAFLQNTHKSKASGNGTRAACILLVFFFFPDTIVRFLGWFWVFWEAGCSPVALLTLQLPCFFSK